MIWLDLLCRFVSRCAALGYRDLTFRLLFSYGSLPALYRDVFNEFFYVLFLRKVLWTEDWNYPMVRIVTY